MSKKVIVKKESSMERKVKRAISENLLKFAGKLLQDVGRIFLKGFDNVENESDDK